MELLAQRLDKAELNEETKEKADFKIDSKEKCFLHGLQEIAFDYIELGKKANDNLSYE